MGQRVVIIFRGDTLILDNHDSRLTHRVGARLFAGNDRVYVVLASQAMIRDRQKTIRVGRQVHAEDVGLLINDMIMEPNGTRIMMAETVVILARSVGVD